MSGQATPAVVVTGLALCTPLGSQPGTLWDALSARRTAVREWPDLAREGFRITSAARIGDTALDAGADDGGTLPRVPGRGPGKRMGIEVAARALRDAGCGADARIGVYVGTTMGESAAFEYAGARLAAAADAPGAIRQVMPRPGVAAGSCFALSIRDALGLRGPARAYGTACAAGNYAIGAGARAVRAGRIDVALCGGVEPFSRIAMVGFSRVRAMSPDGCRPFDSRRNGMTLGEGAAFLVLERAADARARGVAPLATIEALGLGCDAGHPTAPRADGEGMAGAMASAVRQAGLSAADIDWVCAHGSGTRASDAAEANALHTVFGETPPPLSAVKGALGHSLGAVSAIEAVVCVEALSRRELPASPATRGDEDMRLDLVTRTRPAPLLRYALNCAYAFGGINSALLMGRA